jgi:hypothetical protein
MTFTRDNSTFSDLATVNAVFDELTARGWAEKSAHDAITNAWQDGDKADVLLRRITKPNERATYNAPDGANVPVEIVSRPRKGFAVVRLSVSWDKFKAGAEFECPSTRLTGEDIRMTAMLRVLKSGKPFDNT